MEDVANHRITNVELLRALMGQPHQLTKLKLLTELDEMAIDFIRRSPFLVLSTSDAQGNLDASPKGDGPGFVQIEDASTLIVPDRARVTSMNPDSRLQVKSKRYRQFESPSLQQRVSANRRYVLCRVVSINC